MPISPTEGNRAGGLELSGSGTSRKRHSAHAQVSSRSSRTHANVAPGSPVGALF